MRGKAKVETIDDYLAPLPEDKRKALEAVRRTVRAAAPQAEECISYQLPAFRLNGKVLVLFGATGGHCAFYPGSGTAVEAHRKALEGYRTSKGSIRFLPGAPLPAALIRKLVRYRIRENAGPEREGSRRR